MSFSGAFRSPQSLTERAPVAGQRVMEWVGGLEEIYNTWKKLLQLHFQKSFFMLFETVSISFH